MHVGYLKACQALFGSVVSMDFYCHYTVRCRYNAVNFIKNIDKVYSVALPLGRCMRCLLGILPLIDIQPQFLQWCMQYLVILDLALMALDRIS